MIAEGSLIFLVDFEASSLNSGSFPVEVAWVDANGHGEAYLIRPPQKWIDGGGWSRESEAMHGISLDTLLKDGVPVELVAKRAADALSSEGAVACSDQPAFDGFWMRLLLDAGGEKRTVRLLELHQVYACACRPLLDRLVGLDGAARKQAVQALQSDAARIIARAQEAEARRPRVRHRALADAESLWRVWRAVRKQVGRCS